jgi:hypothetical protein
METASYWEYLLVYVDGLLATGLDPHATLNTLEIYYNYVRKDFGTPTHYVGASIGTYYDLDDNLQCFFIAPGQYLANTITLAHGNLQKHGIKLQKHGINISSAQLYQIRHAYGTWLPP